jgi:ribosomal protein L37E
VATVVAEPDAAKAAALTTAGEMTFFSFPIDKVEDAGDGTIEVIGKATDGSLDSDLQVVDPDWSRKALQEWLDTGGNVRVQHNPQRDPAGKGVHVEGHSVRARVVEPVAVKLVKAGVLQDFSVGIMNPDIRRSTDPTVKHLDPQGKAVNGVITGRADGLSKIGEVSLVDRGSNFGTRFAMLKAAASGAPEWVGELTAPDEVIAKVAKAAKPKTVTVELPRDMSLSIKPSDLAKLTTFKQRLAQDAAKTTTPAAAGNGDAPELGSEPEGGGEDDDDDAVKTAEGAVCKRDIDTAARRRLAAEGKALPDGSYPIENAEDLGNAKILALSGHGDVPAARKLIARRARELGVPNPLKDGKKKKGTAKAAHATPAVVKKKKKEKVMCGGCGARQNAKHNMCSECGHPMAGAMPVEKNHAFTCLGCGKDLDKGEPHCPGCGRENPGYLPEADHQIPANQDKTAKPKPKAKKKGKKNPFGDKQAPPFGDDKDDDDDASEKAARVTKGKKKGKKPTPGSAGGVPGNTEKPAGRHREPDGAESEAFEADASMEDGDDEQPTALEARTLKHADPAMAASLMLSTLGVPETMGALHALTCPAYKAADTAEAFPHASFAGIDLAEWQAGALTKAASAPLDQAEKALEIWRAAAALKTCDPHLLADLRGEAHKMFTDANPGPGTFPTPSQLAPARFNRPYLTAGHSAPSPDHEGPITAKLPPEGGIVSEDYTRGYLTGGHAADAPENTHPAGPMPPPDRTGDPTSGPARQYYTNAARDGARHALQIMHDHIAFSHPDICPMHGGDDIARHPVPTPQGVPAQPPAPGKKKGKAAAKAAQAKARKQRKAAAAKRAKIADRVLKGKMPVSLAQHKLGIAAPAPIVLPPATKAATATLEALPAATAPVVDAKTIAKAVKAANKPLLTKIAGQDKAIRRLRRETERIAAQPDTTGAPFRGSALTKQASPVPAGPVTVADTVEHAKAARIKLLEDQWRNDPHPAQREAAYAALMTELGLNHNPPMRT